jgi:hypothetical protein
VKEWFESVRRFGSFGYSIEFSLRGGKGSSAHADKPKLPPEFSFVTLSFDSSSSVTVLVARFALCTEAVGALDVALRERATSRIEVLEGGTYRVLTAEEVKKRLVDEELMRIRRIATSWVSKNLPGLLTSGLHRERLPTMEAIVTKEARPFQGSVPYLKMLGLQSDRYYWSSHENEGLSIRQRDSTSTADRDLHLILAGTLADLTGSDFEMEYLDSAVAGLQLEYFVARWGLLALLNELEMRIAIMRDNALRLNRFRRVRTLKLLERGVLGIGVDAQMIAHDTIEFTRDSVAYNYGSDDDFFRDSDGASGTFTAYLRKRQRDHALRLAESEIKLREVLTTSANLNVAATGIRLQRWTIILAVVSVLIAVLATGIALVSASHLPSWLHF